MNAKTIRVAFTAVVAALAAVFMNKAGVIPVAKVSLPAIAGLLAIPVVYECGVRWGFGLYAVVSVLSFLFTADREAALLYIVFFGYYPVLFALLGRMRVRWQRVLAKVVLFNIAMALETLAALFVLGIPQEALFIGGQWGIALMVLLLNLLLLLYDYTIPGLIFWYGKVIHPSVARLFRYGK